MITIPDMGKSPFALAADKTDAGAAALMRTLSSEYNAALRLGIDATDYDGRNYGLVLADDVMAAIDRFPTSYLNSPSNITEPACPTVTADKCVLTDDVATTTLVAAANANTNSYLWASDRHMGAAVLGERVEGGAHRTPGIEDVIDEDDDLALDATGGDHGHHRGAGGLVALRAAGVNEALADQEIVLTEREIGRAHV